MHIISKFMACFFCSSEELAEATRTCDADSSQAGLVCKLRNSENLQQFGAQTCDASHDGSVAHIHKAACCHLIDFPKGFGMGFIVHN